MQWKKIAKHLLFPHISILILLLPVSAVLLVYSAVALSEKGWISYVSYAVAAYTLTVWCVRMPQIIRWGKAFRQHNPYARRWLEDARLRINVSLTGATLWNVGYGLLQLGLGIYHRSAWFYSLAFYYIFLAIMRFFLVRHSVRNRPGEKMREELVRYRLCGWVFLMMNLALSVMMFYMVAKKRAVAHHEIVTISMAAYTFFTFTMAIVNVIKYRKYQSPVFSAAKAISLAAAFVSMLTLESTMLITFDNGTVTDFKRQMLMGTSGAVIFLAVIAMALYMIVQSTKKLRILNREVQNGNK